MEILLIKIILLSFLITQFEPIQWLLDLLPSNLFSAIVTMLLTCLKCCSFWVGLVMTHSIWMASTAFFISFFLDKIILKLNIVKLK